MFTCTGHYTVVSHLMWLIHRHVYGNDNTILFICDAEDYISGGTDNKVVF
jgi:hypothetical protein